MKNKIIYIICFLFFLNACQSVKDGLSGKKNENSDEFLVKKKNPLELPPSYGDLPEPKAKNKESLEDSIDEDIEQIIKNVSDEDNLEINSDDKSAEDFVLKKIKNN